MSSRTAPGLAISDDEGVHWKVLKEPLLPLGKPGEYDAGVTSSVAVLRTGPQAYQMWYTAGERYAILDWITTGFKRGIVHIGHAVSRDGIEWVKSQKARALSEAGGSQILWSCDFKTGHQPDQRDLSHVAERFYHARWRGLSSQLPRVPKMASIGSGLPIKKSCLSRLAALTRITSFTQMSLTKATNSGCSMSATHSARRGLAWLP